MSYYGFLRGDIRFGETARKNSIRSTQLKFAYSSTTSSDLESASRPSGLAAASTASLVVLAALIKLTLSS